MVCTIPLSRIGPSLVTSATSNARAVATMKRSQGSPSRSRGIEVVASITSRSIGRRLHPDDDSILLRNSIRSASVTFAVVCVTYQRSIRLATDTTTPSVSSASISVVAASVERRSERCECQTTAWESATTLTRARRRAGRVRCRAQNPPSSSPGIGSVTRRNSRSVLWSRSARHADGSLALPQGARVDRRECSRQRPRPARDLCARSLPYADSTVAWLGAILAQQANASFQRRARTGQAIDVLARASLPSRKLNVAANGKPLRGQLEGSRMPLGV